MANASSKGPMYGTPEGVTEGDEFADHAELHARGLHRRPRRGISGSKSAAADSIVMSGGYVDDREEGDHILYTGMDHSVDGVRQKDQSFDTDGNAALVLTYAWGKPLRVIRGLDKRGNPSRRKATGGYRYLGLYRIDDYWATVGQQGFHICQFDLKKLTPGEKVLPRPVSQGKGEATDVEAQTREYVNRLALIRDSKVVQQVKRMYSDTCQICRDRIKVSCDGDAYSEAAHIQALGKPHNGRDVIENVLCLCPTCHVRFDRGVLQLTDDLLVVDVVERKESVPLFVYDGHDIQQEYVRQHRSRWAVSI